MDSFQVTVFFNDKERVHKFNALSVQDAYSKAGRLIISEYDENLSDSSCSELDKADINNWTETCDFVFDKDDIDIGEIEEIDDLM